MGKAFAKMFASIVGSDIYILGFALLEVLLFRYAYSMARSVSVERAKDANGKETRKKRASNGALLKAYSLFENGISIFPLLGMFGTVAALLGLDLATGDMANIRSNFFMALTSTAWGIIFSVIFKIVHAWFAPFFEANIQKSNELVEECQQSFKMTENK